MNSGNSYKVKAYEMFLLNVKGIRHVDIARLFGTTQQNVSRKIKAVRDDLRGMLLDVGIEVNNGKRYGNVCINFDTRIHFKL